MTPLSIALYSDFLCPYCYLLEQNLKKLAASYRFDIHWTGFEIHPELPPGGASPSVLGEAGRDALWERIGALAAEWGIEIRQPQYLPNTHLALEAAEFARAQGKLEEFRDLVSRAYFLEGQDIGDHQVLRGLGERVGLNGAALSKALDEEEFFDAVQDNREKALDDLVTVVPVLLIEGLRFIGAQPVEEIERMIQKALAKRKEAN